MFILHHHLISQHQGNRNHGGPPPKANGTCMTNFSFEGGAKIHSLEEGIEHLHIAISL